MTIEIRLLRGAELHAGLQALAALRIAVFREFPYLYDGKLSYEVDYLAEFGKSPASVLVAAFEGDTIVGAATASPAVHQGDEFQDRLRGAGLVPERLFYFGESVLLPGYRGKGIGHAFFDARETAARHHGAEGAVFAAVIRPDSHPARPPAYRSLDPFWRKRGYEPVPGLTIQLSWKELEEVEESPKSLQCWMRTW